MLYEVITSGEYYIRVYPWFNDITGYRFSTVENPFIDDFPNTFESAHLVEENTTINGNLEFFDDVDYFRFELTEPHNIELAYQSTVGDVGQTSSKILLYDNNHRITSYNVCYTKLLRVWEWMRPEDAGTCA